MRWSPISPEALAQALARRVTVGHGVFRVAIDGPPCARPDTWATDLADAVRDAGRPVVHVPAEGFWHSRSLRLEYGHEDVESYLGWLDHRSLRREVLDAAVAHGRVLPSLRDPVTDRSTRAQPVALADGAVLVVSGALLLGLGLPFDLTVHLTMSPAARARHTPADRAWTLPAFNDYDATVGPVDLADVVVKVDDARHPAVRGL